MQCPLRQNSLVVVIAFLLFSLPSFAADVSLSWDPNAEPDLAGYKIYYGTTPGSYGVPVDVGNTTTHVVTDLGPGTYYFAVTAYNSSAAESPYSNEISWTITPSDGTAPLISSVQSANLTSSSATITWMTDEPGDTQVEYGTTTTYGSPSTYGSVTTLDTSLVLSHTQTLSGLTVNTLYHYRVKSRDAAGNMAVSGDFTFATLAPPDTTPPTVTISAPAAGSTALGAITISASASDNVGIVGVQFKVDGMNIGAEDTSAPYSVSWNSASVSDGSHTLTSVARDAAGNQATSPAVQVAVSNAPAPPTGLTSAYSFNEGAGPVAADASENANTGVLKGATWTASGKFGSALSFNGSSSYVSAGVKGMSAFNTPQTISWWTFVSSNPTKTQNIMSLVSSSGSVQAGFKNSKVGVWKKGGSFLVSAVPPSANAWHHYAYTFDGTTHRLYIDGVEKNKSTTAPQTGTPASFELGRWVGGTEYFKGTIDEFCIYKRALSSTEIQQDMNASLADPLQAVLSGAFGFSEGSGTITTDASVNANTATLANTKWIASGKFGSALSFNGSNSYVSAGVKGMPAANAAQTISWWMMVSSNPGTIQTVISLSGSGGAVQSGFRDSLVGVWQYGGKFLVSTTPPSANAWHHYTYTFDGTTHRLYIDGAEKNSSTLAPQTGNPTSLEFGRWKAGTEFFSGSLDEIRIYKKALSQAEIQYLMSAPVQSSGSTSSSAFASVALVSPEDESAPGTGNVTEPSFEASGNSGASEETSETTTTLLYPRLVVTGQSSAGSENSEYTGIAVVNLDRTDARLRITALDGPGARITGKDITNPASLILKKGNQLPLVDSQLFGSGLRSENTVGWLKVESSARKVAGFFLTFDGTMTVLDGAAVSSQSLKDFVLSEIEDQGFTQMHVANPTSDPATLNFELLNAEGTRRVSEVTRSVNGYGAVAESFADLFPGVTPVASDYIRVSSDRGVVPFQLLGKSSQYVEGLNGQDATNGATTLYSPQYVVGGGDWRSTLSVVNLDSTSGTVSFRFISDAGLQIGPTKNMEIAAKGKIHITDQNFFVDSNDSLMQGYVEVTSSGPRLAGSVVFGDQSRSAFATALPLVSSLQNAVLFGHVASDETYYTGLALVNTSGAVADATVDVHDAEGTLIASQVISIPARQRISRLLTEYFPDLAGQNRRSGYIKVTSDVGLASFALFGTYDLSVLSSIPGQVVP